MLLILLICHPLLEDSPIGIFMLVMLGNGAVLASIYAVSWSNRRLAAGLLLALPSVISTWSYFFRPTFEIDVTQTVSTIVFFAYTFITILQRVFRTKRVGLEELFGALNVYILIGVTWGLIYALVDAFFPGSFERGNLPNFSSTYIYFSFSTLGTLGLGDVRPVLPLARSLCIVEMLVGLFFVAVMFGRLVAVFRLDVIKRQIEAPTKPPFERSLRFIARLPHWTAFIAIASGNLFVSIIDWKLNMPLFLDTWATSVGVMTLGLWSGLVGGVLYNILMAVLFWGLNTWVWSFNSAVVAVVTWSLWKRGFIDMNRPIALIGCGLTIAIATTLAGATISRLAGLPPNPTTLEIHHIVLAQTHSLLLADLAQQFLMETMDKVVSLVIAVVVVFSINELRKPPVTTESSK